MVRHWSEELPVRRHWFKPTGDGERVRGMRYPAPEKLEIIRTVEASHLPVRQTLAMLGIPGTTYYRWYDRWSDGGLDALEDTAPHPGSVWNRLPDETRADVIEFALEHEDLTPRELAVKYTDEKRCSGGLIPRINS